MKMSKATVPRSLLFRGKERYPWVTGVVSAHHLKYLTAHNMYYKLERKCIASVAWHFFYLVITTYKLWNWLMLIRNNELPYVVKST